ncbi:hypothetical protein J4434_07390 [Candidatus Woesearchaeota archaeon]|nr:hypothetical protein [Candidatus Woesearchaeota archaeon]
MISHKGQLDLFSLIAKEIKQDIVVYVFGGNAMMFYGYKDETKDIDILFEHLEEREEFIRVIKLIGFQETSPIKIYLPEKLRDPHRPLMYLKEDIRFNLFVKKIFKTLISPKMKEDLFAVHEFKGNNTLTLRVLRKEHLVILKTVTERDRDFEDIVTIFRKDKDFDWQYLVDEVIWQYQHGDSWVLLDTEEMLKELKKYIFVNEIYLKQLYDAAGK